MILFFDMASAIGRSNSGDYANGGLGFAAGTNGTKDGLNLGTFLQG